MIKRIVLSLIALGVMAGACSAQVIRVENESTAAKKYVTRLKVSGDNVSFSGTEATIDVAGSGDLTELDNLTIINQLDVNNINLTGNGALSLISDTDTVNVIDSLSVSEDLTIIGNINFDSNIIDSVLLSSDGASSSDTALVTAGYVDAHSSSGGGLTNLVDTNEGVSTVSPNDDLSVIGTMYTDAITSITQGVNAKIEMDQYKTVSIKCDDNWVEIKDPQTTFNRFGDDVDFQVWTNNVSPAFALDGGLDTATFSVPVTFDGGGTAFTLGEDLTSDGTNLFWKGNQIATT